MVLGMLLMVSLLIQLRLAWQSYHRIEPVASHMTHLENLQLALTTVEERLANLMPDDKTLDLATRQHLQHNFQTLLDNKNHLASSTPANIRSAQSALTDTSVHPRRLLLNILKILRTTFRQESNAHRMLIDSVSEAAKFEIRLGLIIMIALPVSAIVILYLLRQRIFKPLQQMSYLMKLLGDRQYQRVTLEQADPGLKPVLENYNALVVRLSELESEHLQYQQNLERQVEQSARAVIAQQRSLAQTERMAALGEITARLVHELRNPLAGIKMACINWKKKLQRGERMQDSMDRIELVINEIDRIIQTMNHFLHQAHHEPEPLQALNIDSVINELLTLARYQLPKTIQLDYVGSPELVCRLPDIQFRQALLNLILNAQQAMNRQAGTITVHAECCDGRLLIKVCDEGPGFSDECLNHGIRSFTTRRKDGTGLGLAMVQRFVKNHEGSLEIGNLEPRGACVTMKLNI